MTKKTEKKEVEKKDTTKNVEKKEVREEKQENKKEQSTLVSIIELIAIIIAVIVVLVFFPNTVVWNIVVLLLILTLLIFVHEFGHFITSKMCGVHVYEFALGMGPKVLGFRRKNDPTEYTLRALPIGGFCQLAGEDMEDDEDLPKDKFLCNKPKFQRVIILVAGVTMNFITAIILLFFIAFIWGSTEQRSFIGGVEEGSPAFRAGIKEGDKVVGCNGYKIDTWDKLSVVTTMKNKNDYIEYEILHEDGKKETYKLIPDEYVTYEDKNILITEENTKEKILKDNNWDEKDVTVGKKIGISAPTEKLTGFVPSIKYAFRKFANIVIMMLMILWSLITGRIGLNALSGPVGMYSVVGTVAKFGIANIIYLAAYLSVNLGVLNILPFPAFDGGRVLFIAIEAITHKKVDPKVEAAFHSVGFILLMILMLVITCQDILRLF